MKRVALSAILALGLAVWPGVPTRAWAASPPASPTPAARPSSTISPVRHRDSAKAATAKEHSAKTPSARKESKTAAGKGSPFSAFALGQGRGPINVSSDTLSLDYKGKTILFTGHVRAMEASGGQQLTCARLKVVYGKDFNDMKELVADGDVRISQGTRWVTGDHAVMNQTRQTVILTGSPVVHDGTDQITGSKITVHLDSGRSEVENARAVIFPKQSQTTDNVMAGGGAR